jgi:Nucleoside-diphosphate-sugar epimerases
MNRKIVITGGTGFVGSNLINTFIDDTVYNLGRRENDKCKNIYWSLKDSIEKIKFPSNIDTIIHCASIIDEVGNTYRDFIDVNVSSTLELLEYSVKNNVKHFIYISTGGIYGFGNNAFKEDGDCNPQGMYSKSKYFSEKICMEYASKIKITIIRVFFPYGKGQVGRLISNLIKKIINGERIILNNKGMPFINPIHISDLCNIIAGIVDNRLEGIFNVCGNEIISIKELCEIISNKFHVENTHYEFNNNNCENMIGNNEKIIKNLNYSMKIKLLDGIESD